MKNLSRFILAALNALFIATPAFAISESDYKLCNGHRFRPCVCANNVPKDLQYRPSLNICGGKAAIIVKGAFYNAFSAVVRDNNNRDRWPAGTNFGGCTPYQRDVLALNKCSAFKAHKTIKRTVKGKREKVYCLGASGTSKYFKDVTRITVKLSNKVNPETGEKNIFRACLKDNYLPLN